MQPEANQEGLRDLLTGVYSRATLNARLFDEIERAHRYNTLFSLLLLDIDHFKSINDAFGHARGDKVLVELARRLRTLARSSDLIFRYGGDEFFILLPYTNKPRAIAIAVRLLDGIRAVSFQGDPPLSITLSIGVASFPTEALSLEALFELVDQRQYQAKRAGRDRVVSEDADRQVPMLNKECESPQRLIERDQYLLDLSRFLDALPEQKASALQIAGMPGSGKSRLLAETRTLVQLRGFMALIVEATPALKTRLFGALLEAQDNFADLASPMSGVEKFCASLKRMLEEKKQVGLVILVDNLTELDWATFHFLQEMLSTNDLPRFALIYTIDLNNSPKSSQFSVSLQTSLALEPLSQAGIHIWLRNSLHWEAPPEFVAWFHRETGGLPAHVVHGLNYLIRHEILRRSDESWICRQKLENIPLGGEIKKEGRGVDNNLPRYESDFVGRTEEIKAIKRLLRERQLVTLRGPGGIGKTRLAIQSALESMGNFPQGVYLVALAQVTSADHLVPAIAEALRFTFSSPEDLQTQLLNYLRGKELLLLLDNFEESLFDTSFLERIIERARRITLLVTSHKSLGLSDETVFDIGGLSIPGGENEADGADLFSAVQLFMNSARRVFRGFTLPEEEKHFVTTICRLVGGTPLGIELAAAWTQTFSVRQISAEIEASLSFLNEADSIPGRQYRGLQAVFDSFWKLLSESEHSILRGLSVFRGGFRSETASEVAGASLFFLDSLVAKSQLRRTAQGRYEIHELLQQFTGAKLAALPNEELQIQNRHCDYFADFLQEREEKMALSDIRATDEAAIEIENIRAAWQWALTQAQWATLARLAPGLSNFFFQRSRYQEGENAIDPAAKQLQAILDRAGEGGVSARTGEQQQEQRYALARLYAELARFQNALARYSQALTSACLAIDLSKTERLPNVGMIGLLQAGIANLRQGSYQSALRQLEEALSLAQTSQTLRMEGEIRRVLGQVYMQQSGYSTASKYLEQALQIHREVGDRRGEGAALGNLGLISLQLDNYDDARTAFEQVLVISREINNRHGESLSLNNLGVLHRDQAEYVRAAKYFEQALHLCREFGDRQGEGHAYGNLGVIFMYLGNYEKARQYFELALSLFREIGNRQGEGNTLINLCMVRTFLGDTQAAYDLGQQALAIEQEIGEQYGLGYALEGVGHSLERLNRQAEAASFYEQAFALRRELGQQNLAVESLAGLARVSLAQGDRSQAQARVGEILEHLEAKNLDGTDQPFLVYWTCYKVLRSNGDARALEILNTSHNLLLERAARINDENLQRSYLENVAIHAEIIRELESFGEGKKPS